MIALAIFSNLMLLFKKKFLDAIRKGEKSQTIRLWARPRMKAGQRSYIPGVGYIRIVTVDEVTLPDLTDEDARPDGFATADALRAEIDAIYSQYPDRGQKPYRIRFVLTPEETKRKTAAASDHSGKRFKKCTPRVKVGIPSRKSPIPLSLKTTMNVVRSERIELPADGFLLVQSRRKSESP